MMSTYSESSKHHLHERRRMVHTAEYQAVYHIREIDVEHSTNISWKTTLCQAPNPELLSIVGITVDIDHEGTYHIYIPFNCADAHC
ncbi:hypothetical protein NLJ89_g10073 [Agrocybe chaxingu]|uniref:Uncharacterized protein n=1 Tax=Agrocybe chaxingu TaxID=84603 RepID=A0A9W8MSG9_9AGAR|nr:hypothetical protein NLJ89_g10073 [Agrocybe chaxingu]